MPQLMTILLRCWYYLVLGKVAVQSHVADGGRRTRGPVYTADLLGELFQNLAE